jgi:hypothetical protein
METKQSNDAPVVFISHSHKDKERFVRPFAERLFSNGVHAWVDEWEMNAGDSIVQRLLEEGIKNAQAVIVILSESSINSNWVRTELDAAFIRRVENSSKIIPIVLDNVPVPETLRSILYISVNDTSNYDGEYERVLQAIFDHHPRPALGQAPRWTQPTTGVPGLKQSDATVFKAVYDRFAEQGGFGIVVDVDDLPLSDLSSGSITESVDHLFRLHLVKAPGNLRHPDLGFLQPTTYGFAQYGTTFIAGFRETCKRVLVQIAVDGRGSQSKLVETIECDPWIVNYVLHDIQERDLAVVGFFVGADNEIAMIKPGLRRYVDDFE